MFCEATRAHGAKSMPRHLFVEASASSQTSSWRQTITERRTVIKSLADKLTDTIVKWIVDSLILLRTVTKAFERDSRYTI